MHLAFFTLQVPSIECKGSSLNAVPLPNSWILIRIIERGVRRKPRYALFQRVIPLNQDDFIMRHL